MTYSGGAGKCLLTVGYSGCGLVYEFTPNSGGGWTEAVLYTFARGGGYAVNPSAGLILNNPEISSPRVLLAGTVRAPF